MQPRQVSAGDVPGLVREHPDDLVGSIRVQQRAGIDEYAATVRNESIERAVIDNDDLDILPREPGDPQDRLGIFFEQLLDFRVANDRRTLSRRRLAPASAPAATRAATRAAGVVRRIPLRRSDGVISAGRGGILRAPPVV